MVLVVTPGLVAVLERSVRAAETAQRAAVMALSVARDEVVRTARDHGVDSAEHATARAVRDEASRTYEISVAADGAARRALHVARGATPGRR